MEQVLLNLLLNAMDAMAGKPAGERHLHVRSRLVDHHVEVAVADSGTGITPQLRTHLFDSFYSTKEDGLGLGLSIARSIITAHEGRIWAENNLQGGATFRFALPVTEMVEVIVPDARPQVSSVRVAV
jgi:signal transduction histidine kinase